MLFFQLFLKTEKSTAIAAGAASRKLMQVRLVECDAIGKEKNFNFASFHTYGHLTIYLLSVPFWPFRMRLVAITQSRSFFRLAWLHAVMH